MRETKAMVPSGWTIAHGGSHRLRCEEVATGQHRSPDPTYRLRGHVLVRRLAPSDFKIELKEAKKEKDGKKPPKEKSEQEAIKLQQDNHKAVDPEKLLSAARLASMGYELAAVHFGTRKMHEGDQRRSQGTPERLAGAGGGCRRRQVEEDYGIWAADYAKAKKAKKGKKKAGKAKKKSKRPDFGG